MRKLSFSVLVLVVSAGAFGQGRTLQESTTPTVMIGPLVDPADASNETALTISQADVRLSKNGGNFAQKNDATACTHDELGVYGCPLNATDTGTLGILTICVDDGGNALTWCGDYFVVDTAYYDILDGTTDLLTSLDTGLLLETTVSTATSQTELDLASGASNNDAYNNLVVVITGGTETGVGIVNDYTGTGNILFLDTAMPFTVQAGDTVQVRMEQQAFFDTLSSQNTTNTTTVTDAIADLVDGTTPTWPLGQVLVNSTADSGSTSTIVDATLTAASDIYKGSRVTITSGTLSGSSFCVVSFVPGTDTLNLTPLAVSGITTETYVITADAACIR